jgi:hypothetical protein
MTQQTTNFEEVSICDNFILNTHEILNLINTEYYSYFLSRKIKESFSQEQDLNGGDMLIVQKHYSLYDTIFKTIDKKNVEYYPENVTIYRYQHGNFLPRHRDELLNNKILKDLTFLQTSRNHFKIFTPQFPNGHFIDEIPGRRIILPADLEHEVTKIEIDESIRYTLVMSWTQEYFIEPWWKKR